MAKVLILADDFTGALDTGVQFAAKGVATQVVTNPNYNFDTVSEKIEVIVFDTETRHVSPDSAYEMVYRAASLAKKIGIAYFYKKTDSALRGNIGAELTALMDATGAKRLHFIPAFPRMGRITQGGIQYVNSVPVAESIFGKDPFNPVVCSCVSEIIKQQSDRKTSNVKEGEKFPQQNGIFIYDVSTDENLKNIADSLAKRQELHFLAGCAGFASVLPALLNLEGAIPKIEKLPPHLLVICGSVNPITVAQLEEAEKAGAPRFRILPEQKLEPSWLQSSEATSALNNWEKACRKNEICILDTNDLPGTEDTSHYASAHNFPLEEVRVRISSNMGAMVEQLLERDLNCTLMITGGDTLLGVMNQIGVDQITPVGELITGVVLSRISFQGKEYPVISKSGGFGSQSLLIDLMKIIRKYGN